MHFSELPQNGQVKILDELLKRFSGAKPRGRVVPIAGGLSGAPVFLVYIEPDDVAGGATSDRLNGYYTLKVGTAEWAEQEERRYIDSCFDNCMILAKFRARTSSPFQGFAAVAYEMALNRTFTRPLRQHILSTDDVAADLDGNPGHEDGIARLIEMFVAEFIAWSLKGSTKSTKHLTPLEMISEMLGDKLDRVLPRLATPPALLGLQRPFP